MPFTCGSDQASWPWPQKKRAAEHHASAVQRARVARSLAAERERSVPLRSASTGGARPRADEGWRARRGAGPITLTAVTLTVLVLAGCISMLTYKEPSSGPRARVRFVTSTELGTVLRSYADAQCSQGGEEMMRLRRGPLLPSAPTRLGMPLWAYHDNAAKEVYVSVATTFHGMFQSAGRTSPLGGRQRCGIPFSIELGTGKDYEFYFDFERCSLVASEIVASPDGYRKVPAPLIPMDIEACRLAFEKVWPEPGGGRP